VDGADVLHHSVPGGQRGLPVDREGAAMTSVEVVRCHRCGHGYGGHRPACGSPACDCPGFRWVDPAPLPDVLGYHRSDDLR